MDSQCSACATNAKNALQVALITLGLIGYIMVLIPLIRYRNTSGFAKPFYRLIASLSICDIWGLLGKLVGVIMPPIYSSNYLWPRLMGFWINVTWFLAVSHQLLIAVDRFVALSFPTKEHTFFGGKRIVWSLLCAWLVGISVSVPVLTDKLSFIVINQVSLVANVSTPEGALFNTVRSVGIQIGMLLAILLLYVVTGLNVRRVHAKVQIFSQNQEEMKARKNFRADLRLLILTALTAIPHSLTVIFYEINIFLSLPADLSSTISFLQNTSQMLVYALNPYVYICFSSEVRAKIVDHYFKSNVETIKTGEGTTSRARRRKNRFASEQGRAQRIQWEQNAIDHVE